MNDKKKCRSVNFFNIIATEEHKGSLNQNYFLYWLNIYLSKDFKLPFEIFCYGTPTFASPRHGPAWNTWICLSLFSVRKSGGCDGSLVN